MPGLALEVENLSVTFDGPHRTVRAVADLSVSLPAGRTLGVAGESGSGKSALCLAMLGLHTRARVQGSLRVGGTEVVGVGERDLRRLRGGVASMIFQDPTSALHPFHPVGRQIAEAYRLHLRGRRRDARAAAVRMLDRVGIDDPARRARQYPHELSGGMRQRVMIAMAMCTRPALLIADEPTTALDVTVQAQILELMRDLQRSEGTAIVLVSHDLAVLAQLADDLLVVYSGRAVEYGTAADVLARPAHPYTRGLLESVVRVDEPRRGRLHAIEGAPASGGAIENGCAFASRCAWEPLTDGRAGRELPALIERGDGHPVACHLDADQRARRPAAGRTRR